MVFGRCALAVAILAASGCTTVTSSMSWAGGTLAEGAPDRIDREETRLKHETEAILKEPKTIGAKHILIMHKDSERRPPSISRTREEAKARAEQVLERVRAGGDFDRLVIEYSDEPGAGERNGDLGVFDKRSMVKPFSDAAFKLEVGQISDVVETPFGFHIIKRTQ
ncbi:MAG: peptidylprolyl isomerase [Polyangiaceae bacterium]